MGVGGNVPTLFLEWLKETPERELVKFLLPVGIKVGCAGSALPPVAPVPPALPYRQDGPNGPWSQEL